MCKKHNLTTIYKWCSVMILVGVTTGYAFHLPRLVQLERPRLQARFHVVQPIAHQTLSPAVSGEIQRGAFSLNNDSSASSESSSWVPRIVVPVVAVAVIATATYLIYSRRGG